MLRPEERKKAKQFDIELLAVLRDVSSSLQSLLDEKIRAEADAEITSHITNAIQNSEVLRRVTERLNALVAQRETEHQKQERRFQNRYLFVQWLLFIATAAAFVAAAIYAHIASQQKYTMDMQLNTMTDTFHESQMQSDAIELTAATAAETLRETKNAFVIDQRPYLVAEGPKFISVPATLKPSANINFRNVGKTPARSESAMARMRVYHLFQFGEPESNGLHFLSFIQGGFDEMMAEYTKPHSRGTLTYKLDIAPNQAGTFVTIEPPDSLSIDERDKIANAQGSVVLVYFGFARYEDYFGTPYQTDFCFFFFGTDTAIWHNCPTHLTIR